MFTIAAFTHFVDGFTAIHRRKRTEALVRDLSPELRRDIGWPASYRDMSGPGRPDRR